MVTFNLLIYCSRRCKWGHPMKITDIFIGQLQRIRRQNAHFKVLCFVKSVKTVNCEQVWSCMLVCSSSSEFFWLTVVTYIYCIQRCLFMHILGTVWMIWMICHAHLFVGHAATCFHVVIVTNLSIQTMRRPRNKQYTGHASALSAARHAPTALKR